MLYHLPIIHRTRFRRETYANTIEFALIHQVWTSITFVFYLFQSFIGGTVQLEFEDIDIIRCLDDTIHSSFALLFLRVSGVATHHPHEQIKGVVEVTLTLPFCFLSAHGIRNVR